MVAGSVLSPAPSTEDTHTLAAEIELARNTLAEVQALRLEVGVAPDLLTAPADEPEVSEDSLTSQQWLEVSHWSLSDSCFTFHPDLWNSSQETTV